jgi:streptogrisin C
MGPEPPAAGTFARAVDLAGVAIRFEKSELSAPSHTYGGANLSTCTSGFTVRNFVTLVNGVLTAAHCSNTQTYTQPPNGPAYALTFMGGRNDGNQDAQWMDSTGGHPELAQ